MATSSTVLTEQLNNYIVELFSAEDEFLRTLLREARDRDIPAISIASEQTSFLQVYLKSMGAKKVLEIGSLAGYSAITMARALPTDGKLIACELNSDFCDFIERKLREADLQHVVEVRRGPALETVKTFNESDFGTFDAIFIDADKPNYGNYLHYAVKLLRIGGVVIGDNALAWGQVADETSTFEVNNVKGIRAFNKSMSTHPQLQSTLVPLGDGMVIGVKTA